MQKSEHQQSVERFMALAGKEVPPGPTVPSLKMAQLCARLVLEEALETVWALGFAPVHEGRRLFLDQITLNAVRECNLAEVADGCGDTRYVATYTLSACGIADGPVQQAVDENNLAKFGPGHSINEHGKLIKPPGHEPPDFKAIIEMLKARAIA